MFFALTYFALIVAVAMWVHLKLEGPVVWEDILALESLLALGLAVAIMVLAFWNVGDYLDLPRSRRRSLRMFVILPALAVCVIMAPTRYDHQKWVAYSAWASLAILLFYAVVIR